MENRCRSALTARKIQTLSCRFPGCLGLDFIFLPVSSLAGAACKKKKKGMAQANPSANLSTPARFSESIPWLRLDSRMLLVTWLVTKTIIPWRNNVPTRWTNTYMGADVSSTVSLVSARFFLRLYGNSPAAAISGDSADRSSVASKTGDLATLTAVSFVGWDQRRAVGSEKKGMIVRSEPTGKTQALTRAYPASFLEDSAKKKQRHGRPNFGSDQATSPLSERSTILPIISPQQ